MTSYLYMNGKQIATGYNKTGAANSHFGLSFPYAPQQILCIGTAVCLPYNVTLPDGVDAYVAKVGSVGKVEYEKYAEAGNVIPYGTAVILKPRTGAVTVTLQAADLSTAKVEDAPAENLLEGSFAYKTPGENELYTYGDNGFTLAAASASIDPCSAWLPYAEATPTPSLAP